MKRKTRWCRTHSSTCWTPAPWWPHLWQVYSSCVCCSTIVRRRCTWVSWSVSPLCCTQAGMVSRTRALGTATGISPRPQYRWILHWYPVVRTDQQVLVTLLVFRSQVDDLSVGPIYTCQTFEKKKFYPKSSIYDQLLCKLYLTGKI